MDWLSSFFDGSSPNSNALPLSTPVNTAGNPNSSGSGLNSFFSTLSQLGTTAANAYATVAGAGKPTSTTAAAAAPASSWKKYLPYALIGLVVLGIVWLFRRGRRGN
jgi:MYXO-CTERM domain-containing protein